MTTAREFFFSLVEVSPPMLTLLHLLSLLCFFFLLLPHKEIIPRIAGHMSTGKDEIVKARVLSIFHQVDETLASGIASELGIKSYETSLEKMDFMGSHNWYSGTPGKGKTAKEMAKNLVHLYPQNQKQLDGFNNKSNGYSNGQIKA